MKMRRAALLVIGGAIMLPSMLAMAVFMALHSGFVKTVSTYGVERFTYAASASLMALEYVVLAALCALWGCLIAFARGDDE